MEVEFMACYEAISHILWLRNFISDLQVLDSISKPLRNFYGNSFVVFFSKNNMSSNASKTIDINYLVVKERVQNQILSFEHISINLMIVDHLTKALVPKTFKEHVCNMGLHILSKDF